MLFLWGISMLAAIFVAAYKDRNIVGWFFLSLFFGPIALVLIMLSPKKEQYRQNMPSQYGKNSLSSVKAEFDDLKTQFSAMSNKLNNLEIKISALESGVPEMSVKEQAVFVQKPQEAEPVVPIIEKQQKPPSPKGDIEMNLGKYWLNKIGIVVFSLGIAFLLNYTFAHFGPVAKILFGYLIAVALFITGIKLEEKVRFINYGKVLLGGAWAIIYFTTYAMYHFEASKIINSQLLDLFLLAIVAFGIVAHSLRYKSEALTAIAIFVGYITSVLGDVGYFTLASSGLLAIAALVMVYKMQWVRFVFLGIILTYLTHFAWVMKQIYFSRIPVSQWNVENVYFFFNAGFLAIYWLLFTAAIHLIKNNQADSLYKKLAAANFSNFILFFLMVYPKFYILYPEHKFNLVLGLGLAYMVLAAIMELFKKNSLFISDIIICVSLLTLSVPLRCLPYHTMVIWFIEVPFLLFVGFVFARRVYRYLAFGVSVILFFKFMLGYAQLSQNLRIFSFTMNWQAFLSCLGFVSSAICFGIYRKRNVLEPDKLLQNFYSGFATVYLTMHIWEVVRPTWLTLGFSLESLLIFILGVLLFDKYIRWYALGILALAGMRFCFYERYHNVSELQQLFLIYGPVACAFVEYALYRKLNRRSLIPESEVWVTKLLFFSAASLLVFAIVVYVRGIWITLSLSMVGILALLWGAKISDKYIRGYSLLILVIAAIRFLAIDAYYGVNRPLQWSLILAKLICMYAAYFIYRALDKKSLLQENEKSLVSPLFYASSFLVIMAIFRHITDIWVSVSLGVVGVFLFVMGFLIKEKVFRHGGFIIFGITLLRVVFVDLSGLAIIYKIISFIILGILFLGVSFIYTKYMIEKPK